MNEKSSSISLPEEDYLSILGLIQRFHDYKKREELRLCLKTHLLPLINCDSTKSAFLDPDFSQPPNLVIQTHDVVGYTEKSMKIFEDWAPHAKTLTGFIYNHHRCVGAYDVDYPREDMFKEHQTLLDAHPEHKDNEWFKRIRSIIAVVDRPECLNTFLAHRLYPNEEVMTYREIRILELLNPHLIQAIKGTVLNEELNKFKAFSERLAETDTSIALVSLDHRIIFQNQAFKKLLTLQPGQRLSKELRKTLMDATSKFTPPFEPDVHNASPSFFKCPEGIFRLAPILLNEEEEIDEQCWLLKLKPAVEPYSKMNFLMQDANLTPREIEVASLIRDGIEDEDIADRLFISTHTVKNHGKSIFKKLDIHTRGQLVALLNR